MNIRCIFFFKSIAIQHYWALVSSSLHRSTWPTYYW